MEEARVREILAYLRRKQKAMVRLLAKFVRCESPSFDKAAVDRFGLVVAAEWRRRGARVEILRRTKRGNHVRAEWGRSQGRAARQIMVLGHLDTVYPVSSITQMPFRISGARAFGPGTLDMKAGLVQALFAVDALRDGRVHVPRPVVFLWNSDEEIGSDSSRRAIEAEARRSDAVLVLEPAFGRHGRLKTARKGVGTAEIIVTGRSAHAGIDPEKGVNAVHELALQVAELIKMNDPSRGITVQVTVIQGGTVSNVVAGEARAEVDLRYSRLSDSGALDRRIRRLRPILPGARVEVRGGVNRPPLERTKAVGELFARAKSIMRQMGVDLGEAATGGGSDGNLTAALGVPTLDGVGAVGDGAHSPREHVVIPRLPERAALLATLLATWPD
jgi:glutamate carboxypeptidase